MIKQLGPKKPKATIDMVCKLQLLNTEVSGPSGPQFKNPSSRRSPEVLKERD